MSIDLDGIQIASHEAAHCAAALSVGRRVLFITREGHGPQAHGLTDTEPNDKESIHEALIVLLAAVVVQPRGGNGDVKNAQYLASFTPDPERTMAEATDDVLELVRTPDFRRTKRVVEEALWSRPSLTGEDIDLLLNQRKDQWLPSV